MFVMFNTSINFIRRLNGSNVRSFNLNFKFPVHKYEKLQRSAQFVKNYGS